MHVPINRLISNRVTPWLAYLQLTPNQVSVLSLGAGLLSALCFLQGTPRFWLLGAFLFQGAYLLDNCDGELARMTNRSSGFGSWLDTICDCLIHMSFFLCLGFGIYRTQGNLLWLKLGLLCAGFVFLTYLSFLLGQIRGRGWAATLKHPDPPEGTGKDHFWGQLQLVLRNDFSLVVLVSALFGWMTWLLWGGVVGASCYVVLNAVTFVSGQRQ